MAFARTVATTHTKTLIAPSTGVADKVYGADYVSASSHTSTGAVSDATSGGVPYFDSATSEASSALLAQYGVVIGGGAGGAPNTVSGLTFGGSAAGTGLISSAGTATTDVALATFSRTNNNAAVVKGFEIVYMDTTSAAGFLPWKVLGTATGAVNLASLSKAAVMTLGQAGSLAGKLIIGDVASVNGNISIGGSAGQALVGNTNAVGVTWQLLTDDTGSGGHASLRIGASGVIGFSATNSVNGVDSSFSRISAGVVGVGTGAQGSSAGSVRAKYQSSDGTAGVAAFGPGVVTSITVKDGIIVAIS